MNKIVTIPKHTRNGKQIAPYEKSVAELSVFEIELLISRGIK